MLRQEKLISEPDHRRDKKKKPYRTPHLSEYGDVRDLTLGGSPGIGESSGVGEPPRFKKNL